MRHSVEVFIVNTPRQWWIACAIAFKNQSACVLLIENGFQEAALFAKVTQDWDDSPFEEVVLLFGKNNWQQVESRIQKEWLKKREKQRRYKELRLLLKKYNLAHVYASNVGAWNVQYLLHLASESEEIHCSYMDDGTLSYYEQSNFKTPYLKYIQRKLHYGWWYKKPYLLGETPWVNRGYVFSSKYANSHLQLVELIELDESFFNSDALEQLAKTLLYRIGFDLGSWKNKKNVLVLSRINMLEKHCPGYSQQAKEKILSWESEESDIWVKYHPRELTEDPLMLKELSSRLNIIPSGIPFEILLLGMTVEDKLSGDISTVLMDAKLQHPGLYVESSICRGAFSELIVFLKKIGVDVKFISG